MVEMRLKQKHVSSGRDLRGLVHDGGDDGVRGGQVGRTTRPATSTTRAQIRRGSDDEGTYYFEHLNASIKGKQRQEM